MSKNNDNISKFLITIIAIGFAAWFGGSLARTAMGYELFYPDGYLTLKNELTNDIRMHTVKLFTTLALYTSIGYTAAFLAAIALFVRLKKRLKIEGRLFMSFILLFIAAPVQFYLIYFDWQLAEKVIWANVTSFDDPNVQKYFLSRFNNTAIATFSALAFLLNLTCLLYVIWQPLSGKSKE